FSAETAECASLRPRGVPFMRWSEQNPAWKRKRPLARIAMLRDALPQLVDTLLRLPLLDAAQLRELIQHLPEPYASAQEMLRRGWVTEDQCSTAFPGTEQRRTPRETMLLGFGDSELPPDADGEDWELSLDIEDDKPDVPVEIELAQPGTEFSGQGLAPPQT